MIVKKKKKVIISLITILLKIRKLFILPGSMILVRDQESSIQEVESSAFTLAHSWAQMAWWGRLLGLHLAGLYVGAR